MYNYHKTVLINEVLEYLNIKEEDGKTKIYVDATFGGGGHTRAILDKDPNCKVIGIDWDKNAIKKNSIPLIDLYKDRLKVVWGNFVSLPKILEKEKIEKVDGILADFGTSQYQIHHKEGFSFQVDTQLDMRMSESHSQSRASDILNKNTEKELSDIFFNLGEETRARKIAKAVVFFRQKERFKTTRQLAKLIEDLTPGYQRLRIHPATKVFQALRIFVNKELENIENFLKYSIDFLSPGARIACISFHSLEDRIVKKFFKQNKENLIIITKKPVTASVEEINKNPSSRSAKLRVAEKS